MRHPRQLPWLALAAVGDRGQAPVRGRAHCVKARPELRRNTGVQRITQYAPKPPVHYLPGRLPPELEVEAARVDRPGTVGVDVDPLPGGGDEILEVPRITWLQAHVGHPDDRLSVKALGTHAASGARVPDLGGALARREKARQDAVANDWQRPRFYPLVIPAKTAEPAAQRGVGGHVHQLRAIAQGADAAGGDPAGAGVRGLVAKD